MNPIEEARKIAAARRGDFDVPHNEWLRIESVLVSVAIEGMDAAVNALSQPPAPLSKAEEGQEAANRG